MGIIRPDWACKGVTVSLPQAKAVLSQLQCRDRQTMGKRRYRRKKASLEVRSQEHREKIACEQQKPTPDLGLTRHWEREIEAFQAGIQSALKRLGDKE